MKNKKNTALILLVTTWGISSVITQVIFAREIIALSYGDELYFSIFIALWLVFTGLGALGAKAIEPRESLVFIATVIIAVYPHLGLLGIRIGKSIWFFSGVLAAPVPFFALVSLVILPYCFISGYVLSLAWHLYTAHARTFQGHPQRADSEGIVYVLDSVGDIIGGALFSFVLIYVGTAFTNLVFPALLVCGAGTLYTAATAFDSKKTTAISLVSLFILSGLGVTVLGFGPLEKKSLSRIYGGKNISSFTESAYGRIVVTQENGVYVMYQNDMPFFNQTDARRAQELVHTALAQISQDSLRVLILGGGNGNLVTEALRYPSAVIDYVELDPAIIQTLDSYSILPHNNRVQYHFRDGREFLATTEQRYHAVLINLPPPATFQLNRFYTVEFFSVIRQVLREGGVAAFSLDGVANYVDRYQGAFLAALDRSAKEIFKYRTFYPLTSTIFIVSPTPLSLPGEIPLKPDSIQVPYVSSHFVKGLLTTDRLKMIQNVISEPQRINRDSRPSVISLIRQHYALLHGVNTAVPFILCGACMVLLFFFFRKHQRTILSSGFTSISMELICFMLFQMQFGYLYKTYSLMLTLFMAALLIGGAFAVTLTKNKRMSQSSLRRAISLSELVFIGSIVSFALAVAADSLWRNSAVIYGVLFVVALCTGFQFPLVNARFKGSVFHAERDLYGADFIGAAAGSFITVIVFVPFVGIPGTLFILCGIKTVSFVDSLVP